MKYSDYIPLAAVAHDEGLPYADGRPKQHSRRRRAILGTALAIVVVAGLYFISADLFDDAEDLYLDDLDVILPEFQTAYIPFKPPSQNSTQTAIRLTPAQVLPEHCRDAYFSSGALCYDPVLPKMDVVWTWVNGSDPLLQDAKLNAESNFSPDDPYRPKTSESSNQARQYRDNDELRHSMRSVLANYRPYARHFHLITSDFALPEEAYNLSVPESWRLGQLPQWLDMSKGGWRDGEVQLNLIHHAEIFRPYAGNSFNSYAIESQFGNLPNVSDYFVYLNDDFYMSNPLTPRSFYTSVYGLVFRFDLGFMVSPEKPAPDEPHGEWRSMGESNVLLGLRFGSRHRPYVLHEAKAASLPLMRELSAMWAPHLARAAAHPFRETVSGAGDVSMLFLLAHFVVERWREALLWSWTVAKHGGLDDAWNEEIMREAWLELGGGVDEREVTVKAGWRETLEDERVHAYWKESGHRQVDKTFYVASALDGYPYAYVTDQHHDDWQWFKPSTVPEDKLPECTISFDECFTDNGEPFTRASDVFKHIAFQNIRCGDCVIQAVMKASGRLGMEAFLPSPFRVVPANPFADESLAADDDDEVPHLSLEERWQDGQFSIPAVLGGYSREVNVRAWTLQLLQRYRFVVGYTPYIFVMLENNKDARGAISWIDSYHDASLLCINDDVKEGEDEVSPMFVAWQEKRWGKPAAWERSATDY